MIASLLGPSSGAAQDPVRFDPAVGNPAYPADGSLHPSVLFDDGHNNTHRPGGNYLTFTELIRNDGYRVSAATGALDSITLVPHDILVIATPQPFTDSLVNWSDPVITRASWTTPALTEEECDAILDWVRSGGALLLITGHAPRAFWSAPLAGRFGVDVHNSYAADSLNSHRPGDTYPRGAWIVYTRENGLLPDHPITNGRSDGERVRRIRVNGSASLAGPPGSRAFLRLGDSAYEWIFHDFAFWDDARYTSVSAAGRTQGVALRYGEGRVVVLAPTALFSEPYLARAETDDRQLALNLMHWLSGLTDPAPESPSREAPGQAAPDHTCLVLPGSWSDVTRSFAIDDDGRLTYVSEVEGGVWHQRAAVHPTGPTVYVAASVREGDPADQGLFVYAYGLDRESCELGPRLQAIAPSPDTASGWRRYYGLEMHPNGRFLYQTTEASREIRLYHVAEDGTLTFVEAYDVTGEGAYICDHVRRLEIHPDGAALYSNCNNRGAGDGVPPALQAWSIAENGRLDLLEHHHMSGMDAGVFDPTVHPNGLWLYQPTATANPDTPGGRGAYVLIYHIDPDRGLRRHAAVRVADPDADEAGSGADELPLTALPSTILIHPDGTHAYVTLHDQVNFTHHIVAYRIEPKDGGFTHVFTAETTTTGTGNHHGGVLATRGGRTFLYTFVNVFPGPEGFIEQYEIGGDYRLIPLDPRRVPAGLMDARHPVVIGRAPLPQRTVRPNTRSSHERRPPSSP